MKIICSQCNVSKDKSAFITGKIKLCHRRICNVCLNARRRLNYKKNQETQRETSISRRKQNLLHWTEYLIQSYGESPKCKICKRPLGWTHCTPGNVVCLDHRLYNGPIQEGPKKWMQHTPLTPRTITIFRAANFGILCKICNGFLGRTSRKQKSINLFEYLKIEDI